MTQDTDRIYDAEDTALVHFGYDSGLYGSLLISRFIGPKTGQIRLAGSRGIVDLERGRIRRLASNGTVVESLTRDHDGARRKSPGVLTEIPHLGSG